MNTYETPEVADLGSLADLTQGGATAAPDTGPIGDGTIPPSV